MSSIRKDTVNKFGTLQPSQLNLFRIESAHPATITIRPEISKSVAQTNVYRHSVLINAESAAGCLSVAIRILVPDDNNLVRSALCALLRAHQGWLVCSEAKSGREAIQRANKLKPDVALVDVSMPDLNGFEVVESSTKSAQVLEFSS